MSDASDPAIIGAISISHLPERRPSWPNILLAAIRVQIRRDATLFMKGFARRGSALAVLAAVAGVLRFFAGETQAAGPQYVVTDLGTLGGDNSAAYGVNNLGQVTGYADLTNDSARHAYLYSNGAMTDLGTLGGTVSYGYAISNAGHVTGYSVFPSGNFQAFLASMGSIGNIGSFNNNTQASEGHG